MEAAIARPRRTSASPTPPSRRRLSGAHRRRAVDHEPVPARPHHAAATRPANQAARSGRRAQTSQKTPRPSKAWRHVGLNFAKTRVNSRICANEVLQWGLKDTQSSAAARPHRVCPGPRSEGAHDAHLNQRISAWRRPEARASLRGARRRSNPQCGRHMGLDCFASLAMTDFEPCSNASANKNSLAPRGQAV
jgi:hypothetical protein